MKKYKVVIKVKDGDVKHIESPTKPELKDGFFTYSMYDINLDREVFVGVTANDIDGFNYQEA